jgi:hypothetical protein
MARRAVHCKQRRHSRLARRFGYASSLGRHRPSDAFDRYASTVLVAQLAATPNYIGASTPVTAPDTNRKVIPDLSRHRSFHAA